MSESRAASKISVRLQDFRRKCRSNVCCGSKITAKGQFVIRVCRDIVAEHYPIIPGEFAYMADVGRLSGHDCLRGLAGGLIDVVYCA